jgi:hypothetical protein
MPLISKLCHSHAQTQSVFRQLRIRRIPYEQISVINNYGTVFELTGADSMLETRAWRTSDCTLANMASDALSREMSTADFGREDDGIFSQSEQRCPVLVSVSIDDRRYAEIAAVMANPL